jgi:pimeloyl-ACP methyl ester carboxylesterase
MYERFRARPPFASWRREVLRDYCRWGLLPSPMGEGHVLACPPQVEASVYEHAVAPDSDLHAGIPSVTAPVTVMRAGKPWNARVLDLGSSPTDPRLAERFPNGRDVLLEGCSHYIPMEVPERVAGELHF